MSFPASGVTDPVPKKVTVVETFAKGGLIKGCGPEQVGGKKFSGTY